MPPCANRRRSQFGGKTLRESCELGGEGSSSPCLLLIRSPPEKRGEGPAFTKKGGKRGGHQGGGDLHHLKVTHRVGVS